MLSCKLQPKNDIDNILGYDTTIVSDASYQGLKGKVKAIKISSRELIYEDTIRSESIQHFSEDGYTDTTIVIFYNGYPPVYTPDTIEPHQYSDHKFKGYTFLVNGHMIDEMYKIQHLLTSDTSYARYTYVKKRSDTTMHLACESETYVNNNKRPYRLSF